LEIPPAGGGGHSRFNLGDTSTKNYKTKGWGCDSIKKEEQLRENEKQKGNIMQFLFK
jgi:hypothetical protein